MLWLGMPKRPEAAAWGAQANGVGRRDTLCKEGKHCCHLLCRQHRRAHQSVICRQGDHRCRLLDRQHTAVTDVGVRASPCSPS